jgi:hypothetical protein
MKKKKKEKGGRTVIDFDYLDRKKLLLEQSKTIASNIIADVYKNNSNIINNVIFCIDSVLAVVNQ